MEEFFKTVEKLSSNKVVINAKRLQLRARSVGIS